MAIVDSLGDQAVAIRGRWAKAWIDALASAAGAVLAWILAQWAFGHPQPIFASVAAVVCLAPGVPSRAGQAVNMMLGLVTGIIIGEVVLFALPQANAVLLIPLTVFLAILAAVSFGLLPVIAIQGGVSALLVLALGPTAAGEARLLDALAGTLVGMLFSQILLTPDPVRLIGEAAHRVLSDVGQGLSLLAGAAERRDAGAAGEARERLLRARESINLLEVRIGSARSLLRWSLRGRLRIRKAKAVTSLYEARAILLHASALVLADTLSANLGAGLQPPPEVAPRIAEVAATCLGLGGGGAAQDARLPRDGVAADWRTCLDSLHELERLVRAIRDGENSLRTVQGEAR